MTRIFLRLIACLMIAFALACAISPLNMSSMFNYDLGSPMMFAVVLSLASACVAAGISPVDLTARGNFLGAVWIILVMVFAGTLHFYPDILLDRLDPLAILWAAFLVTLMNGVGVFFFLGRRKHAYQ